MKTLQYLISRIGFSGRAIFRPYRILSAASRMLPDFLIIGAQKCGTTSLYSCIVQHPQVRGSSIKEVHYFDLNYNRGHLWYRSHFPLMSSTGRGKGTVTGEASPYYILHPLVPERVHKLLPDVKLIAILRNPVDRAISHYYHVTRRGRETLSLEEAIAQEPWRLAGELNRISKYSNYDNFIFMNYSYFTRGLYYEQLKKWMKYFDRERLLILNSESFFSNPEPVMRTVFEFLSLDDFPYVAFRKDHTGNYPKIELTDFKSKLKNMFKSHNDELFNFLGYKYDDW